MFSIAQLKSYPDYKISAIEWLVHRGESPYIPSMSFARKRESRVSKRTLDSGSSPGMTTLRIAGRRKTCTQFCPTVLGDLSAHREALQVRTIAQTISGATSVGNNPEY